MDVPPTDEYFDLQGRVNGLTAEMRVPATENIQEDWKLLRTRFAATAH